MRHYKMTKELREEINRFLGKNYINPKDVGHELYYLENYEAIARVAPKKARLLMATLFPEELKDPNYLRTHKKDVLKLARSLHIEKKRRPRFSWDQHTIRREALPFSELESDENIFEGNIVRFG